MRTSTWRRKATKKAKTSPAELAFAYQNQLEDFDLMAQDTLVNLHYTPEQFDDTDYYRLLQIMGARSKEDRPVDPAQLYSQLTKG